MHSCSRCGPTVPSPRWTHDSTKDPAQQAGQQQSCEPRERRSPHPPKGPTSPPRPSTPGLPHKARLPPAPRFPIPPRPQQPPLTSLPRGLRARMSVGRVDIKTVAAAAGSVIRPDARRWIGIQRLRFATVRHPRQISALARTLPPRKHVAQAVVAPLRSAPFTTLVTSRAPGSRSNPRSPTPPFPAEQTPPPPPTTR